MFNRFCSHVRAWGMRGILEEIVYYTKSDYNFYVKGNECGNWVLNWCCVIKGFWLGTWTAFFE